MQHTSVRPSSNKRGEQQTPYLYADEGKPIKYGAEASAMEAFGSLDDESEKQANVETMEHEL